jgi:hypothetical protein
MVNSNLDDDGFQINPLQLEAGDFTDYTPDRKGNNDTSTAFTRTGASPSRRLNSNNSMKGTPNMGMGSKRKQFVKMGRTKTMISKKKINSPEILRSRIEFSNTPDMLKNTENRKMAFAKKRGKTYGEIPTSKPQVDPFDFTDDAPKNPFPNRGLSNLLEKRKQKNLFLNSIHEKSEPAEDEDMFDGKKMRRKYSIDKYERDSNYENVRFASPQHKRKHRNKTMINIGKKSKFGSGGKNFNSLGKNVDPEVAEFWAHENSKPLEEE